MLLYSATPSQVAMNTKDGVKLLSLIYKSSWLRILEVMLEKRKKIRPRTSVLMSAQKGEIRTSSSTNGNDRGEDDLYGPLNDNNPLVLTCMSACIC